MADSNPPSSLVERVQNFVSEHKKVVLIASAAAVVGVAGAAYYASTSRRPRPPTDEEAGGDVKDKKKKGKSSSKKKKTTKDADGPLLEERNPKVEDASGACCSCLGASSMVGGGVPSMLVRPARHYERDARCIPRL